MHGARIPDLKSIREKLHLHARVTGIIAMRYRVHNAFCHNLVRDIILHRCLWSCCTGSDRPCQFRHNKINRLIDQIKDCPFVYLVGRNGLAFFQRMKVHTLQFWRDQKTLGRLAEQENGCMIGNTSIQKIQMGQDIGRSCFFGQGIITHIVRTR